MSAKIPQLIAHLMVQHWMLSSLRSGVREGSLFSPLLSNNCFGGPSQGSYTRKRNIYPDKWEEVKLSLFADAMVLI